MALSNINQMYADSERYLKPDPKERDRRLRHRLEKQTSQIKKVFNHNQLPVEVTGGSIYPRSFRYELGAHLSDGLDRLRLIKRDLINSLGISEVSLKRVNGRLGLNVGRANSDAVDLLDLHAVAPDSDGVSVILGLDDEGKMAILNLADDSLTNVLISGGSAAGKSGLMRTIAVSLALANRQSQVQLGVIAAPGVDSGYFARPSLLKPLSYLPHTLFPFVSTPEESVEALQFLTDELTYREETGLSWPLLVVLIDKADVLLKSDDYALVTLFSRLANASPKAGIRLIISATNPEGGALGRILKHNVSVRFSGRTARNSQRSRHDETSSLDGHGDFLALSPGTKMRFQAARVDDYDLHLTLEDLHHQQNIVLLAQAKGNGHGGRQAHEPAGARSFFIDGIEGKATLDHGYPVNGATGDDSDRKSNAVNNDSLSGQTQQTGMETFDITELVEMEYESISVTNLSQDPKAQQMTKFSSLFVELEPGLIDSHCPMENQEENSSDSPPQVH